MAEVERALPIASREPRDVSERFVWGALATLFFSLLGVVLLALWIFPGSVQDRRFQPPMPVYPEPRLQANPREDMRNFYAGEMQRLNSVGWVDKAHGVVHIPILQAMQDVARRGIPGWPAPGGAGK